MKQNVYVYSRWDVSDDENGKPPAQLTSPPSRGASCLKN